MFKEIGRTNAIVFLFYFLNRVIEQLNAALRAKDQIIGRLNDEKVLTARKTVQPLQDEVNRLKSRIQEKNGQIDVRFGYYFIKFFVRVWNMHCMYLIIHVQRYFTSVECQAD